MSNPLDIKAVIVCDGVRREDNGKAIVIGAYVGDILVQSFPVDLPLTFFFVAAGKDSTKSGDIQFKIEHGLSNGERPSASAKVSIPAGTQVGRTTAIAFPPVPFRFDEPTELVISVLEDDEWKVVDSKSVRAGS
jgi:hypothetical protein